MRYSPSLGGFYPEDIYYPNLPNDLIEITFEYYEELLSKQEQGYSIQPDGDGVPQAIVPEIAAPGPEDVNSERSRRILEGTIVSVTDYGNIPLQGRLEDQVNLQALGQIAFFRVSEGDVVTITRFRDRDNVEHQLTPPQVFELWTKGAEWISGIYKASWDLKNLGSIPEDFRDNTYWE